MNDKNITIIDIFVIIISFIALLVSIHSCVSAKQANQISQAALIIENRPLITAVSMPCKSNTNQYFDVEYSDNQIFIVLSFSIENKGHSPAENVHVLPNSRLEITTNNKSNSIGIAAMGEFFSKSSIAPGDKYELSCRIPFKVGSNIDTNLVISTIKSDQFLLRSELHLVYDSAQLGNRKFSTRIRFEYTANSKPLVLLSEFLDITDDCNIRMLQDIVDDGTNQINNAFAVFIWKEAVPIIH